MGKFNVYYEQKEVKYAIIEAESIEEAEELADLNYDNYVWDYVDGSITGEILYGSTEEYHE